MHRKQFKISITTLISTILIILTIGAISFSLLEDRNFIDSFYFVTMTATTVGYGDIVPTTPISKIITIIYSLSIVPFVLYVFSIVTKYQTEKIYRKIHGVERKQRKQEEEIETAEESISNQKKKLLNQIKELDEQEKKLNTQVNINKKQTKELNEQEKELEVVENIVEKTLVDKEETK